MLKKLIYKRVEFLILKFSSRCVHRVKKKINETLEKAVHEIRRLEFRIDRVLMKKIVIIFSPILIFGIKKRLSNKIYGFDIIIIIIFFAVDHVSSNQRVDCNCYLDIIRNLTTHLTNYLTKI